MKLLWLQITMFFTHKNTKHFIKVFIISFSIMLGLIFFLISKRKEDLQSPSNEAFHKQFIQIMNMPQTTNHNIILEQSRIYNRDKDIITNNFWQGNALNYRYLKDVHGIPK